MKQLALWIEGWLAGTAPAVVGLNEFHEKFRPKLLAELAKLQVHVEFAQDDTNCLLWRAPQ